MHRTHLNGVGTQSSKEDVSSLLQKLQHWTNETTGPLKQGLSDRLSQYDTNETFLERVPYD